MPDVPTNITFIDTETTSLKAPLMVAGRRVWEIAMIRFLERRAPGSEQPIARTSIMVEVALGDADPFSLQIGGFYDRHPQGRHLTGRDTAARFSDELVRPVAGNWPRVQSTTGAARSVQAWTHGQVLVGAVPSFDMESLNQLMTDEDQTPSWHYRPVDVETVAYGWLLGRRSAGYPTLEIPELPWSSDKLALTCNVTPPTSEERHTAMGDALWVMRWWTRLHGLASG